MFTKCVEVIEYSMIHSLGFSDRYFVHGHIKNVGHCWLMVAGKVVWVWKWSGEHPKIIDNRTGAVSGGLA